MRIPRQRVWTTVTAVRQCVQLQCVLNSIEPLLSVRSLQAVVATQSALFSRSLKRARNFGESRQMS
jgi:hypothetical protein